MQGYWYICGQGKSPHALIQKEVENFSSFRGRHISLNKVLKSDPSLLFY